MNYDLFEISFILKLKTLCVPSQIQHQVTVLIIYKVSVISTTGRRYQSHLNLTVHQSCVAGLCTRDLDVVSCAPMTTSARHSVIIATGMQVVFCTTMHR